MKIFKLFFHNNEGRYKDFGESGLWWKVQEIGKLARTFASHTVHDTLSEEILYNRELIIKIIDSFKFLVLSTLTAGDLETLVFNK